MQVTKFSDYALRVLIHLAFAGDERLSARDIAMRQGVSVTHLAKTAQWLASEGYVNAARGRGGGMTLARDPSEISIGLLLRRSEAGSPVVECMREDGGSCALTPACGLMPLLSEAQEAFFAHLDPMTLADVLKRNSGMRRLVASLQTPA